MYGFELLNESHRDRIIEIFNYYVEKSNSAFPESRVDGSFYDKLIDREKTLRSYAVIDETGKTVGFCMLKPYYYPVSTFGETAEVGYFFDSANTGKGIGLLALERLIEDARQLGKKTILACISGDNAPSLKFHLKNGFRECGRFVKVGRKFGKTFDIVWMQRDI